jgi:hypothetical protein
MSLGLLLWVEPRPHALQLSLAESLGLNCLSYRPSTNDERAQFASAITDELLLRDMDSGDSGLDEMRSMLE